MKAFAYRSGEIEFSDVIPSGALPIIGKNRKSIPRARIEAGARLAYDGKTLLVPGIPEAESDDEAYRAFEKWIDWLSNTDKYTGATGRKRAS